MHGGTPETKEAHRLKNLVKTFPSSKEWEVYKSLAQRRKFCYRHNVIYRYPNTFKFTPIINLISDCVRKNIVNNTLFLAPLALPILRLLYRKCYTTEYPFRNTKPAMPTIQVHEQKILLSTRDFTDIPRWFPHYCNVLYFTISASNVRVDYKIKLLPVFLYSQTILFFNSSYICSHYPWSSWFFLLSYLFFSHLRTRPKHGPFCSCWAIYPNKCMYIFTTKYIVFD